jgi:hypothetical protein
MLKDGTSTSLWIRNIQMYLCGVVSASLGLMAKDSEHLHEKGFFWGYNKEVWCVIGESTKLFSINYQFFLQDFYQSAGFTFLWL